MTVSVTFPANVGGSGATYSDGTGVGGMAQDGHRTYFFPLLQDYLAVADFMSDVAEGVDANLAALLAAPGTNATSSSSVAIGTGAKAFTIETGKAFVAGMWLLAADTAAPTTNWMLGQIASYNSGNGALSLTSAQAHGSGTKTAWTLSLSGPSLVASVIGLTGDVIRDDLVAALALTYGDIYDALGYAPAGTLAAREIAGLEMSPTTSYETTRVTVATGQCRDSTNVADIMLLAPLNKRLDAAWAAGSNNGGRDTGSLAADQTWHVFVITDVGTSPPTVDVLFSQSPTAPTLPAGYDYFRRIGSVILEKNSTAMRPFFQHGNDFKLVTRSKDFIGEANGVGPYLRVIAAPNGIRVKAQLYLQSHGNPSPTTMLSGIYDPALGSPAGMFGQLTQWAQIRRMSQQVYPGNWGSEGTAIVDQWTDTTRHVYTYSSDSTDVIVLGTLGWSDLRD